MAETLNALVPRCAEPLSDPEDATGVVIGGRVITCSTRRSKGAMPSSFHSGHELGRGDIQGGDIGPGTAAGVFVLDMHGSARPTTLRGMLAAAGLNAGFFIGGDHEFIILQRSVLPLAGVESSTRRPGRSPGHGEDQLRCTRPKGIFMQPRHTCCADRGHQTALLDLLNQVAGAPSDRGRSCLAGSSHAKL